MRLMARDEEALVSEAVVAGFSTFRDVVEAHKKQVYYLALDLTGNHHDAEDLSQEVFIKAYQSMKDFRGDAKLSSWLHRITVNAFLDSKRKRSLRLLPFPESRERPAELPFRDERPDASPDRRLETAMIQRHIDEALEKLTPRERAVFVLRHYNDLILRDVGQMLNISEGTVKTLLFRALRRLQKELRSYRPEERGQ